jgi:hypothetical protein
MFRTAFLLAKKCVRGTAELEQIDIAFVFGKDRADFPCPQSAVAFSKNSQAGAPLLGYSYPVQGGAVQNLGRDGTLRLGFLLLGWKGFSV